MHFASRWAVVCALVVLAACSKNDNKGDAGVQGGDAGATAALGKPFKIVIQSADVPASGNPSVTFLLTEDDGTPITDLATEISNAAASAPQPSPRMSPRFSLGQLEDDGTYTHLYEVSVNAQAYTDSTGAAQTPSGSTTQPRTEPPSGPFPTGQLQDKGGGVYTYTFSPPTTPAAKLERTRTYTVGFWATRTVQVQGVEQASPVSATFSFVPGGGTPKTFEHVTDQACNACHGVLLAHDSRAGVQLCLTCHGSDREAQYLDPETLADIDLRAMVHKIHRGSALPSVVEGGRYHIVGFRQTDHDYSKVAFPQDIRNCAVCHQGQDAVAWKASVPACISCHDNVRLDGTGTVDCAPGLTEPCNHTGGAVGPTSNCGGCHPASSVTNNHVSPTRQALSKYAYEITEITVGGDRQPVVTYRVVDPTNGNAPYALSGTPAEPWAHPPDSRLFVDIAWPSAEYTNEGAGTNYGQPVSIDALKGTAVAGQTNVYQVTSPVALPAGVEDFTVVLEGHPAIANPATAGAFLRVPVPNAIKFAKVSGGDGVGRRVVTPTSKCNACHELVTAHGANRNGDVQVCALCHNPEATDKNARGTTVTGEESIDLKVLIHLVHGSAVRETPVDIYGFGGAKHTFPLGFTRNVGDCNTCHAPNTWNLPLKAEVHETTLTTGSDPVSGADNTRRGPVTAVCLSCHDQVKFDGSAGQTCGAGITGPCNHPTPNATEAQCSGCHGAGGTADVAKVHPISL